MFCPQCGSATAPQTKFCKSCGSGLFELVPSTLSAREAQQQLHKLKGTKIMALTPVLWLFTLFMAFIAAVSRGPEQDVAGIITFFATLLSLSTSLWGIFNLWRGEFFKQYREQRVRAEAALLTRKPQPVAAIPIPTPVPREIVAPPPPQPASLFGTVTEHTTRELQKTVSNSGKLN